MSKTKGKKAKIKELEAKLSNSGIEVISLSNVNQSPIVSERMHKNKDFVFNGVDNLYPSLLIRLADNSALHSSIIGIKQRMIAGNGLVFDGTQADQAEEFFKEALSDDTLIRISTDQAMFDGFYLNVQFNKGGEIGTINHIDFSFMRSGKMDLKTRKVPNYWMSTRWDIATRKMVYTPEEEIYRPIEILAFDPKLMKDKQSRKNGQIIQSKTYSPGKLFYNEPAYRGALNWIEIAGQIAQFHKSQLENGMTGNVHIHINADLTNETKRLAMLQQLNDQYTGSKNAGRIFLTYGVGEAGKVELTPLSDTGAHQSLTVLNDNVNQEIISSHAIPKQLVGVDVKAGLGGLQLREAIEMFHELQIQPRQNQITTVFNDILKFNNIDATVSIDPLQPATFILDNDLMKLTHTVNEVRTLANSPELMDGEERSEDGDKLLIEVENGAGSEGKDNPKRPTDGVPREQD